MLDIQKLINNKINNKTHDSTEINFIISSYLKNKITNKDMALWLKEIFDKGMTIDETVYYTDSIINSGKKITFNNLDGYIIDKHSTGGIGDKVSLVLGPILAA